jgi:hypothetical protein
MRKCQARTSTRGRKRNNMKQVSSGSICKQSTWSK